MKPESFKLSWALIGGSVLLALAGCTPQAQLLNPTQTEVVAPMRPIIRGVQPEPPEAPVLTLVAGGSAKQQAPIVLIDTPQNAEKPKQLPNEVPKQLPPIEKKANGSPNGGPNGEPNGKPEKKPEKKPEILRFPKEEVPPRVPVVMPPGQVHVLPLSLDTILRSGLDQNGQIAVAREKVNEALAQVDLAEKCCLPDLYIGGAYYRHEGGIQNFNGQLVHSSYGSLFAGLELRARIDLRDIVFAKVDAERKVWQQEGDLSKLTADKLLEATTAYVELLAARTGEAVGLQLESKLSDLVEHANKKAKVTPAARGELYGVNTELFGQRQLNRKLRESAAAATAKLIYLLGLDPHTEFVLVDKHMGAFDLVDIRDPHALVDSALTNGPGIRELEGLLALINDAEAKANGPGRFLPIFEVSAAEGAFGAGPGGSSTWANRLDYGLQFRWNLTDLCTANDRARIAQAKRSQAEFSHQDLRSKLTMGVFEAREAIISGIEQISLGESQIKNATEAYDFAITRLKENLKDASIFETVMKVKTLAGAQFDLIRAIRDHDTAQLRLLIITGRAGPQHHGAVHDGRPH